MTLDNTLEIEAETRTGQIKIHKPEDFEGMRRAGKLAAECLDMLIPHVQPGMSSDHLDTLAREFILDHGALPACLFYRGYPKTVCISRNHVVCHGIPGDWNLKEGDIVNIDVTVIVDGWHGDSAISFSIGQPRTDDQRLSDVTRESMWRGIAAARIGGRVGDISAAVEGYVRSRRPERYGIIREFTGHGIGSQMHQAPDVPNHGRRGRGPLLTEGICLAVEPMLTLGGEGETAAVPVLSRQVVDTVGASFTAVTVSDEVAEALWP